MIQFSSSYGIGGKTEIKAHIFTLTDGEVSHARCQDYVRWLNLQCDAVKDQIWVNKGAMHKDGKRRAGRLGFPLDPVPNISSQLIYVAPPVIGEGVPCSITPEERLTLVEGPCVPVSFFDAVPSTEVLDAELQALRKKKAKEAGYKMPKAGAVETDCGQYPILGVEKDEEFVHFEIDEDYHKENPDNPRYYVRWKDFKYQKGPWVRNFNGDARRYLAEINPEKFEEWKAMWEQNPPMDATTVVAGGDKPKTIIGFMSRDGGLRAEDFCIATVGREGHIAVAEFYTKKDSFKARCKELGISPRSSLVVIKDPRPEMLGYKPDQELFNLWSESPVMREARKIGQLAEPPPLFKKLIENVTGSDPKMVEYVMNWLACVVQHRDRTQTALVVRGIEGTGKGTLFELIRDIVGFDSCANINQKALIGEHNGEFAGRVFQLVNEINQQGVEDFKRHAIVDALKDYITEPFYRHRAMRQDGVQTRNFCSYMLATNNVNGLNVSEKDRRFTICEYMQRPLSVVKETSEGEEMKSTFSAEEEKALVTQGKMCMTSADVVKLKASAVEVARYLAFRTADQDKARIAINTEGGTAMGKANEDSLVTFFKSLTSLSLVEGWREAHELDDEHKPCPKLKKAEKALRAALEREASGKGYWFNATELFELSQWQGMGFRSRESLAKKIRAAFGATIPWGTGEFNGKGTYAPEDDYCPSDKQCATALALLNGEPDPVKAAQAAKEWGDAEKANHGKSWPEIEEELWAKEEGCEPKKEPGLGEEEAFYKTLIPLKGKAHWLKTTTKASWDLLMH